MTARARHGDAPRWILGPVLVVFVGLPLLTLAYVVLVVATNWSAAPPLLGPVVSVVVVLTLLWLFGRSRSETPMTSADRTYYRLALLLIGLFGLMGTWRLGAVAAVPLLLYSLLTDRRTTTTRDQHPVTRA